MKYLVALIFGALVGVSGTLLHNAYQPIGLLISFLAIWLGSTTVRSMFASRACNFLFILGWNLILLRASSIGNGGEVLVEANVYGNFFAFGGTALLAILFLKSQSQKDL